MQNLNASEEELNDENLEHRKDGRWSGEQHSKFLEGLKLYGKNWKKIESIVPTRTGSQIRSHAQKYFNKLERKLENQQYTQVFDQSSSLQMATESEKVLTDRVLSTRSKPKRTLEMIEETAVKEEGTQRTLPVCSRQATTEPMSPLRPNNRISYNRYSDIWKHPEHIMSTDFLSTFVDLKSKPKHIEVEEFQTGRRKRSFVTCENDDEEELEQPSKYRLLGPTWIRRRV